MRIDFSAKKRLYSGGHQFNLDIEFSSEEDITVIFGPSGAGKSLVLKMIAGLEKPDQGSVKIDSSVMFDSAQRIDMASRERNVGYLFQDYALFPHLTVEENINFSSRRALLTRPRKDEARLRELLEVFHLEELAKKYPAQLSGGQRQRVGLARSLMLRPSILLLDEPFAALDPLLRMRMREELKKTQRLFSIPVLIITHDPQDVAELAQRLILMDDGIVKDIVTLIGAPYRDLEGKPIRPKIRELLLRATGALDE